MVAPDSLMDSSTDRSASKGEVNGSSVTNNTLSNGNETSASDIQEVREENHKQPSYVALACCISGYTTLSYDSKQRQGLRSRTVSPIRPEGVQNASYTSGNYLSPIPRELVPNMQTQDKVEYLNGCGGLHSPRRVSNMTITQETRSYTSSYVSESYTSLGGKTCYTTSTKSYHSPTNGDLINGSRLIAPTNISQQLSPSSFIEQRVERLYGPGALAQGFYARKSLSPKTSTIKDVKSPKPENVPANDSLPVLKLLRPEFRAQLNVAHRKTKGNESEERLIPHQIHKMVDDNAKVIEASKEDCVDATITAGPNVHPISDVKDGHYYLQRLAEQVQLLESLASSTEDELAGCDNEEGCGILRAAAGKARLLVSQKLNQFQGLCHNNIKQSSTEDFPTTNEDLAGFWDMVMIQVKEVLSLFDEINELRKTDWKKPDEVGEKQPNGVMKGATPTRKSLPKRSSIENKISPSNKARDEARKKLIEERRKAMKENKSNSTNDTLFVI